MPEAPTDPIAQDLAVAREDLANVHYTIGNLREEIGKVVDADAVDTDWVQNWVQARLEELEEALGIMASDPPAARLAESIVAEPGHIYGSPDSGQWVWSGTRWRPVRAGTGALSAMTGMPIMFDGLQWLSMWHPLEAQHP